MNVVKNFGKVATSLVSLLSSCITIARKFVELSLKLVGNQGNRVVLVVSCNLQRICMRGSA